MSEYFRVLKRIEGDQPDIEVQPASAAGAARPGDQPLSPPAPPQPAPIAASLTADARVAFVRLFDNIRTLANGNAVRTLVFAGASAGEPVRAVIAGLSAHVKERGLTVLTAELGHWSGRTILRSHSLDAADSKERGAAPTPLELGPPARSVDAADWVQEAERVADLVLIEGLPLEQSIDSALLARTCDGLVIVATTGITARDALAVAAQRAQTVGCRAFGLVLHSSRDRAPRWLQRFVPIQRPQLPAPHHE
jgi:hypothetical protein